MKLSRVFCVFSLFILLLIAPSETTFAQALPAKVKSYLDKTYPNWKPSTLAKTCGKQTNSVIQSDFDGNGRYDYAVKIKSGRKGFIIAFLNNGANFKPFVLENTTAKKIDDTALDFTNGEIQVDICELYIHIYVYRNGKFSRD